MYSRKWPRMPAKSGMEQDYISKYWRRMMSKKPNRASRVKRVLRRRERHTKEEE